MKTSYFLFFIYALTVSLFTITQCVRSTMSMQGSSSVEDMKRMVQRLKTQQGELFDAQFLKLMIKHHQRGEQMAKLAARKAIHHELREMAHDTAKEQSKEIAQMKSWQQKWGYQPSEKC